MYAKTHRKHAWKLKGEFEQKNMVNNKHTVNASELISLVRIKKIEIQIENKMGGIFFRVDVLCN